MRAETNAIEHVVKTLQIGMSANPARGGGLNRYFFDLLRALPQTGIEPTGLVAGDTTTVEPHTTNVHSFSPIDASILERYRGVRSAVRDRIDRCDLVVSHFAPYAFPALDIMKRRPHVVHFHGPWKAESLVEGDSKLKAFMKGRIERAVYDRGRRFIVLSHAFGDILAENYRVSRSEIRVIPGGVECDRYDTADSRADSRMKLGWPADRPIVLSVRRLVTAKGLENLVEAAQRVVRSVPNALFLIGGTGPLADTLRRSIQERGLEENVRLCGFIPESALPVAYAAADISVVPTIALEGFGLVVVESLAAGTPALVTPIGGLPEVVTDLDERLVLRGVTPEDVARGICAALAPNGTSPFPSRAACKTYARRFDWKTIAARIAAVYREVR